MKSEFTRLYKYKCLSATLQRKRENVENRVHSRGSSLPLSTMGVPHPTNAMGRVWNKENIRSLNLRIWVCVILLEYTEGVYSLGQFMLWPNKSLLLELQHILHLTSWNHVVVLVKFDEFWLPTANSTTHSQQEATLHSIKDGDNGWPRFRRTNLWTLT